MVIEVSTGLKVQRFIFLDWNDRNAEQIRASYNIALELDVVWSICLYVVVYVLAGDSNFFFSLRVPHVPRAYICMF